MSKEEIHLKPFVAPPEVREQFCSIASDFLELRVSSTSGRQDEIHATVAAQGTRLHLTSAGSFQVMVMRKNRTKGSTFLSRERVRD